MASCLATVLSVAAILYVMKIVKYNFKDENRPKVKKVHSISQLTIILPFILIIIGALFFDPLTVIVTLIILSCLIKIFTN